MARVSQGLIARKWLIRIMMRLHILLYRLTGGIVGGLFLGGPTLLLTTRGHRSGRTFTTPLFFLVDGDSFVVVASAGGSAEEPAWCRNLRAHPQALVEVGPMRHGVQAEVATPETRERLWPSFVRIYPPYEAYQRSTSRRIPLVVLRPS